MRKKTYLCLCDTQSVVFYWHNFHLDGGGIKRILKHFPKAFGVLFHQHFQGIVGERLNVCRDRVYGLELYSQPSFQLTHFCRFGKSVFCRQSRSRTHLDLKVGISLFILDSGERHALHLARMGCRSTFLLAAGKQCKCDAQGSPNQFRFHRLSYLNCSPSKDMIIFKNNKSCETYKTLITPIFHLHDKQSKKYRQGSCV